MKDNDIFASRILELRDSLSLTQEAFTQGLGVTPAALSSYEQGTKKPSLKTVIKIATKYNVSIDWLCGLSEKKEAGGNLATCGDIIREIDLLSPFFHFDNELLMMQGAICLSLTDKNIVNFYIGKRKMLDLLDAGTIDKHLYNLWLDDAIKKLDKMPCGLRVSVTDDSNEGLTFY